MSKKDEIKNPEDQDKIETQSQEQEDTKETKHKVSDVESLKSQLETSNTQLVASNTLLNKAMDLINNFMSKKSDPDKEVDKADRGVVDWKPGQQKSKGDDYLAELVPYFAFKDNDKYKDDITVSVNGYTYQIQRGKHVMIPRFVLHVIENSERQRAASVDYSQGLIDDFDKKSKQYGIAL